MSDVKRIPGASSSTLIISSVQKSNEGSYHCVVSNCAGNQTSEPAKLNIGKIQIIICSAWNLMTRCIVIHLAEPPRITVQPHELKCAVPGNPVIFTVQATGTEPLNYKWQQNVGGERGGWQSCDVEGFPGANSSTITIHSVQKSNEGSYRCVISNNVDSQISEPVQLSVGEIQIL